MEIFHGPEKGNSPRVNINFFILFFKEIYIYFLIGIEVNHSLRTDLIVVA